jgi:AAA+ ATPase superfamily predicted ATPase
LITLNHKKSSFLAIYGRRRVGKTEIVRYFCEQNSIRKVEFAGRVDQNRTQQIKAFESKLKKVYGAQGEETIKDWNDAFYLLMSYLETFNKKEKIVVFLDELPWMDTAKSGFLGELADFWNDFCSQRSNILLIVCGSAASYMMKKVIHNRGALHGRLTDIMPMQQFDLNATKKMLEVQGCKYSDKSIVDTWYLEEWLNIWSHLTVH